MRFLDPLFRNFLDLLKNLRTRCFLSSFKTIGLPVLKKNIFNGFAIYSHGGHLSCSCDLDLLYQVSFPLPNDAPHHYENLSMQYTEILKVLKKENFQQKIFDIFLIFARNIDCGYTLEPPRRGGSNEHTQSMF